MFEIITDNPKLVSELSDVVKLFFPDKGAPKRITQNSENKKVLCVSIDIDGKKYTYEYSAKEGLNALEYTRFYTRSNKLSLYKALVALTGRELPWGSLTGIRPTKLAYELINSGKTVRQATLTLQEVYLVSAEKAALIEQILNCQQGIYRRDDRLVNIYIHIPFCTSRCNYCSFMTNVLTPSYKFVQPYVDALAIEINQTFNFLKDYGYKVYSVYVGGGTPTALNADQLRQILSCVKADVGEFTCEAGRPDTITEEKLKVMADCGVNRISVNPQSLCDATLERIGRKHTSSDFLRAYEAAKKYPFIINTDLIAGLDAEGIEEFSFTVDGIVDLKPHNVTVHTLARKNGSAVKLREYEANADIELMMSYAQERLSANAYLPYYLYRQKQMLGNLENIGYCLSDYQCVNNITTMEECLSVAACGAGAISKRVFNAENRIERLANLRDVKLYLEQFDVRLTKKKIFFENQLSK